MRVYAHILWLSFTQRRTVPPFVQGIFFGVQVPFWQSVSKPLLRVSHNLFGLLLCLRGLGHNLILQVAR